MKSRNIARELVDAAGRALPDEQPHRPSSTGDERDALAVGRELGIERQLLVDRHSRRPRHDEALGSVRPKESRRGYRGDRGRDDADPGGESVPTR